MVGHIDPSAKTPLPFLTSANVILRDIGVVFSDYDIRGQELLRLSEGLGAATMTSPVQCHVSPAPAGVGQPTMSGRDIQWLRSLSVILAKGRLAPGGTTTDCNCPIADRPESIRQYTTAQLRVRSGRP